MLMFRFQNVQEEKKSRARSEIMALFIPGWKTSKNYIRSHDPRYFTDVFEWASCVYSSAREAT